MEVLLSGKDLEGLMWLYAFIWNIWMFMKFNHLAVWEKTKENRRTESEFACFLVWNG